MSEQKRKKILFIIPVLSGGGAERIITYLVNHISRDKYIPQLLLLFNTEHTYLSNLRDDVEVIHLNVSLNIKYYFFQTLRGILRQKPDIVFSGLSGINVLLSVFIPFFKKIRWFARETNTVSQHVSNKRMLFLYRNFYKNYHTIIAQCDDMKADLVENFNIPHKKVTIINNPINTDFIDGRLKEDDAVQLPENKINLLACGRLTHQKGFDLLIEAFAVLTEKEKYHLSIIGGEESPAYTKFLLSLVKKHQLEKLITFAGYQTNSYKWFQKADVFVLSSRYEGFPNVVLEALYCGTPVLANNCKGGITEIIKEGQNGFIFDFEKDDFETKLEQIVDAGLDGKEIARKTQFRFDLQVIIEK
ncbi:MAG: glycosyltransferase, partial [Bacteroidetes bacterium]|nr:glycosyltransferase [Bacteroidota bacterium]